MPARRERAEDIPLLVEYFLDGHNHRYRQQKKLNRAAMRCLLEYPWPGKVRELELSRPGRSMLEIMEIIKEAIRESRWNVETDYFRCKRHKKGSMHIAFKRLDLVQELNRIAGGNRIKSSE